MFGRRPVWLASCRALGRIAYLAARPLHLGFWTDLGAKTSLRRRPLAVGLLGWPSARKIFGMSQIASFAMTAPPTVDVVWTVRPLHTPRVLKTCPRCDGPRRFISSDKFR